VLAVCQPRLEDMWSVRDIRVTYPHRIASPIRRYRNSEDDRTIRKRPNGIQIKTFVGRRTAAKAASIRADRKLNFISI
jgi:inorganic pyrophosphatase